jgi:hypothetical protein
LTEIRDSLIDRIAEAQREGWLGEVEGLEISLAGAEEKLVQLEAALKSAVTHLGLPTFDQIAGLSTPMTVLPDRAPEPGPARPLPQCGIEPVVRRRPVVRQLQHLRGQRSQVSSPRRKRAASPGVP